MNSPTSSSVLLEVVNVHGGDVSGQITAALLEIAEIANAVDREIRLKQLANTFDKVGVRVLRKQLNKILGEKRRVPQQSAAAGRKQISVDDGRSPSETAADVVPLLKERNVFLYGGVLVKVRRPDGEQADEMAMLPKPEHLQGLLMDAADFTREDKEGAIEITLMPRDLAAALPHSSAICSLPTIRFWASSPVLDESFQPLKSGYNPSSKVYLACDTVSATDGTSMIDELLSGFCLKENADRANFIALLLTSLIHHHDSIRARVPIGNISGNKPGVGKGELAQVLSIIREGKCARTVSLIGDEVELEKRMCSVMRSGSRVLLLDNAKTTRSTSTISSPVIERTATDPLVSFRILGASVDLSFENTVQILVTHNGGIFSKDLVSRMVPIRLSYHGDPGTREFIQQDIRVYAANNRMKIVSELLGMFEKWKNDGMCRASVKHRNQNWASIIGGVLEANGVEGFLTNVGALKNPLLESMTTLVSLMDFEKKYRATELLNMALKADIFADLLHKQGDRSPATFGKLITQFVGERFCINGAQTVLNSKEVDGSGLYFISKGEIAVRVGHRNEP